MQPTLYTPPSPEELQAGLDAARVSAATARTYRSGLRRLQRDLAPGELVDPAALADYRAALSPGTRNVFDALWHHLRGMSGGALPDLPPMPRVRFAHPLAHDLMTISGYVALEGIPETTVGLLAHEPFAGEAHLARAVARVYEFQTQRLATGAPASTPLVPLSDGTTPMRSWRVEHLINSAHRTTDGPVDRLSCTLAEALAHNQVTGVMLRDYLTLLWRARARIQRSVRMDEAVQTILSLARGKQYAALREALVRWSDPDAPPPLW